MDIGLALAGLICIGLAYGHTRLGVVWILPSIAEASMPRTPFGPPPVTVAMIRVTWYIVTLFAASLGALFLFFASVDVADPRTLVLRWFAGMWAASTLMAYLVAPARKGNLRRALRMPVPLLWLLVAALLVVASA